MVEVLDDVIDFVGSSTGGNVIGIIVGIIVLVAIVWGLSKLGGSASAERRLWRTEKRSGGTRRRLKRQLATSEAGISRTERARQEAEKRVIGVYSVSSKLEQRIIRLITSIDNVKDTSRNEQIVMQRELDEVITGYRELQKDWEKEVDDFNAEKKQFGKLRRVGRRIHRLLRRQLRGVARKIKSVKSAEKKGKITFGSEMLHILEEKQKLVLNSTVDIRHVRDVVEQHFKTLGNVVEYLKKIARLGRKVDRKLSWTKASSWQGWKPTLLRIKYFVQRVGEVNKWIVAFEDSKKGDLPEIEKDIRKAAALLKIEENISEDLATIFAREQVAEEKLQAAA